MAEDKKISAIPLKSFSDFEGYVDSANDIFVPASVNLANWTINIKAFAKAIQDYLDAKISGVGTDLASNSTFLEAVASAVGSGGGNLSGGENNQQITNRFNRLESRVETLESTNTWPVSSIGIKNTSTNEIIYYPIVTGPGLSGIPEGTLIIEQSNINLPNFYALLSISVPIAGSTTATVSIYNRHSSLNLLGGTIGTVAVLGTIYTDNGGAFTVLGSSDESSTTLVPGTTAEDHTVVTIPLSASIGSGNTVTRIEVTGTISSKAITGSATYISSGAGVTTAADGYITL